MIDVILDDLRQIYPRETARHATPFAIQNTSEDSPQELLIGQHGRHGRHGDGLGLAGNMLSPSPST